MIQTAVLGYGTVGSGVVEVLEQTERVLRKEPEKLLVLNMCWICGNFREVP